MEKSSLVSHYFSIISSLYSSACFPCLSLLSKQNYTALLIKVWVVIEGFAFRKGEPERVSKYMNQKSRGATHRPTPTTCSSPRTSCFYGRFYGRLLHFLNAPLMPPSSGLIRRGKMLENLRKMGNTFLTLPSHLILFVIFLSRSLAFIFSVFWLLFFWSHVSVAAY